MRRLLTWIAITLGIAALVRRLRRRRAADEHTSWTEESEDPAGELRAKLAESRAETESPPEAEAPEATVEERRAGVHDQGRSTLDDMRPPDDA
jgi:hypothetical protein